MKWSIAAGLFLLIVGLCLISSGPSHALPPTTVNISPSSQTVNSSQMFTVGVYVTPGEPIIGVTFALSFNASLLQANSVTEGNLLNQGCETIFLSGTRNNTTGTITGVGGSTTGGCTVSSPGTFAYIAFTARNVSGTSFLNMSSVAASDVNVSPVSISVSNGSVTVVVPGITVTPTSGLVTTESLGTATFTIVLNTLPTANVVINLSSSDTLEGTVSPASVTFSTSNWSTPRPVTVTGVNDAIPVVDGNIAYTIITAAATSDDTNYNGLNAADVSVTNNDNDVAGFTVTPTSGLVTTEALSTATFTIKLNTQPAANVRINLSSSDTSEGNVSPASVTFSTANWSTTQTVTVTGGNDNVDDGNIAYTIITANASSTDIHYDTLPVADVAVTNTDKDTAGFTVTPTSGLVTTEAGGTATFTIRLNSEPTADVIIGLSSSNILEGTVSPTSVTFGAANWSTTQTVTVTGVDDLVADGNIAYSIITAAASSTDTVYNNLPVADVGATNNDNDFVGITVNPTSGLVTTEAGGTATFTIVLNTQPIANVVINLSSSNILEGTVSPSSVTFSTVNWSTTQTVTATGVNDFVMDGPIVYSIITAAASSTDPNYSGRNAADVSVTNSDNDTAGITVNPTSGLVTSEAGGQATFTIVLTSQPTASVSIVLSSNDSTEGTVSPPSVTFGAANWNISQTVTVTGFNDFVMDGPIVYSIITAAASSTDPNYSGRNAADVSVTNSDNDTAGITVNPTSGLVTSEAGGQATFTIVLTSQPTASVSIVLSSNNSNEGTVLPSSVTFTTATANWSTPQTVTATGVDDALVDGPIVYSINTAAAISTDPNYSGRNAADVIVTNSDNDTPGITVNPTSGLVTTEAGGIATFTIVLNTQPIASVSIGLSSNNSNEGTVSPASVTFGTANWSTQQPVTVTGVDDLLRDGPVGYTINTAAAISTDPNYSGRNAADVSVINNDNDSPGITVNPTSGLVTTEAGGTATFTIVLDALPTADVVINLSSSDTTEGNVSPASVTFTTTNWSTSQTVTVTGVSDNESDGSVGYNIITDHAVSGDTGYDGLPVADVSVTNMESGGGGSGGGGGGGGGSSSMGNWEICVLGQCDKTEVNSLGKILDDFMASSADITVSIDKYTKMKGADGKRLAEINIEEIDTLPAPLEGYMILKAFDFNPNGAKFDPGIRINMKFDPNELELGQTVAIAYYDESTGAWQIIEGIITEDGQAVFTVDHFSVFAVMATEAVSTPAPTTTPTTTPSGGLGAGAWAGIAVGIFIALVVVVWLLLLKIFGRKPQPSGKK